MAQILNKFPFAYVNECFLRNREFLTHEDEHLWDLIEYADNDALVKMFENRHMYSSEIQYAIDPVDFIPPKVKMRVVELTDAEMAKMNAKNEERMKREMEEAWEQARSNMNRPLGELDEEEDIIITRYSDAEMALNLHTNKKAAKYVAPSARGRQDPEKDRLVKMLAQATLDPCHYCHGK